MDAIFMNAKNNKNSEPHVLILKLTDKLDLRMVKKKMLLYQNVVFITHGKTKIHILYQIFKIIFSIFFSEKIDNP